MPYKDPADKIEHGKRWRKKSIESGYGKWLYARRSLRFADAEHFLEALKEIERTSTDTATLVIVEKALAASKERWTELGPSPTPYSHRHPSKPDKRLLEHLAKLDITE